MICYVFCYNQNVDEEDLIINVMRMVCIDIMVIT